MFLQKAMKQGRNDHRISHAMTAHKGDGHIVWLIYILSSFLLTRALLPIVLQQCFMELSGGSRTTDTQIASGVLMSTALLLQLNFT